MCDLFACKQGKLSTIKQKDKEGQKNLFRPTSFSIGISFAMHNKN